MISQIDGCESVGLVNLMEMKISWNTVPRLVVILYLAYMLIAVVFLEKTWFFVDGANLMFHEAGHFILGLLGPISGTALQMVIPTVCVGYFLVRKEWFSGVICVFWAGENLVNISVYIKDAIPQILPLVGGGEHDWTRMLSEWGVLEHYLVIGGFVFWVGVGIMLVSWLALLYLMLLESKWKLLT